MPAEDRRAVLEGRPLAAVPEDAVAVALDRLERFAWVGVTERHHDGLQLLSYPLHHPPPARRAPLNEGEGRPRADGVAPDVRQALVEHNRGDAAVYRAAERLFAARHSSMVDDLLANPSHAPAPSSFDLDLAGPVADRAWYDLEGAGTRPFRWLGGRVTFDALIDRSVPRTLEVELVAWVDDLALEKATLAVDGTAVLVEKVEEGTEAATVRLRASVAARPANWVQRTRVDIEPGSVSRVAGDPRVLGLAVAGVHIR